MVNRVWQSESGAVLPPPAQVNLWQVLWQRRLLVLLGTLAGVGAGLAFVLLAPASYQSSAQVLVVQKRPDAMTGLDTRQVTLDDYMETHQELVKSLLILDRAVHEASLASLPSLQSATESPPEVIQRQLVVNRKKGPGGSNNVLQITFKGGSADDCALVLRAILASYKEFLERKYQSITSESLDLLIRDRAGLQQELARKEEAYQKLLERRPLLARSKEGPDLRKDRLDLIQARQAALLVRRTELQSQLAAIAAARKQGKSRESLLAMIADFNRKDDPADLGKEQAAAPDQLAQLLLEEQKLLERFGPDHPEVQSVRRRIKIARGLLALPRTSWGRARVADGDAADDAAVDTHVQVLTQKLGQVKLAEERLDEVFHREEDEARRLASYEVLEESLRTGRELLRQSYEAINKRLADVSLVKGAGGYDVEVIGPPATGRKVFPQPLLILPVALVLGFLAGVGLACLRQLTARGLRSAEEVSRLGLPVVGCIPTIPAPAAAPTLSQCLLHPMLCVQHRPHTPEAEAYRALRRALCFRAAAAQLIQVTSPTGGEGKSTLAANLALAAAAAGKRVLLVDADWHTPGLAEMFGVRAERGLAEVLAGLAEPKDVVHDSGLARLGILGWGATPAHPADLLTLPRFQELLDWLREHYDIVLVDSPDLASAPDAAALAARMDGVLLAVRLGGQRRPALERARGLLAAAGAAVLGAVVNRSRSPLPPLPPGDVPAAAPSATRAQERNGAPLPSQ